MLSRRSRLLITSFNARKWCMTKCLLSSELAKYCLKCHNSARNYQGRTLMALISIGWPMNSRTSLKTLWASLQTRLVSRMTSQTMRSLQKESQKRSHQKEKVSLWLRLARKAQLWAPRPTHWWAESSHKMCVSLKLQVWARTWSPTRARLQPLTSSSRTRGAGSMSCLSHLATLFMTCHSRLIYRRLKEAIPWLCTRLNRCCTRHRCIRSTNWRTLRVQPCLSFLRRIPTLTRKHSWTR